MLRQIQQQKLQQKLSPQQIQLVKMLEVTTEEMKERIIQEVDENPALEFSEGNANEEENEFGNENNAEEGNNDDFTLDDYASDDDIPDDHPMVQKEASYETRRELAADSGGQSINEHLTEQLNLSELNERQRTIAEYLAGSVDEDGYLRRNAATLSDDIAINIGLEASEKEVEEMVRLVQQLDPPGVGAFDLRECLLLQLQRKQQTKMIKDCIVLISDYFDDFTKKHYESIIKKMDCNMDELKLMIQEIVRLNPKPGSVFGSSLGQTMNEVIPDFILENEDGNLQLSLNSGNMPELHVSKDYINMLNDFKSNEKNQTREAKSAIQFAKDKVDSARWFIDAVRQRQETLMRTMKAIVDYQYEYFTEGDEKLLKPMILKVIADKTGYDISTISRVSNSKYIQTSFGVFPVKHFFTEGMKTDSGEEVSALEIKTILKQSVDEEDKSNPLTDEELSDILKKKGYVIARRTIAKYREQVGIPVARMRREI